YLNTNSNPQPLLPPIRVGFRSGGTTPTPCAGGSVGSKTVGRWLKERREKKKEEVRVHNAQLHAAVSVAAVAAAVAATAAATAAASGSSGKDEHVEQTDMAMASAATLVAARCVEAAEAMGADKEQLASVISSAVNVQSHGDFMTLTAAAATALRGAATLKARTTKEVLNAAAVLPVEKGVKGENRHSRDGSYNGEADLQGENFLGLCNEEILARGSELLKRTRTGELHWKIVSVYIDKTDQVVLKMKSRHVAGTLTKKKKKVLMEVCKDLPVWPERRSLEIGGGRRFYFGLKTVTHRVIEFECKSKQEYDVWTQGVSRLLSLVNEKKKTSASPRNNLYWN
ncbi:VAN3-binding protein, partial [Bienertia sinuspersici]